MELSIQQHQAILGLTKFFAYGLDFGTLLRKILEVDAETLSVRRVSIWLFETDHSGMHLYDLLDVGSEEQYQNTFLSKDDYPNYFKAIEGCRLLIVDDVYSDTATAEMLANYLTPLGVTSMLDVPIIIEGSLHGVVCHEHIGRSRHWLSEECGFAASIADLIGQAILVDQLRRARTALRASEARAQGIFHSNPNALLLVDDRGGIKTANQRAAEMFRTSQEALEQMVIEDLIPVRFRNQHARFRGAYHQQPHHRTMGAGLDLCAQALDGSEFPVEVGLCPLVFDDVQYVICAITDITLRKNSESQLRVLFTALEQMPASVVITDDSGVIQYANPLLTLEMGKSKTEIVGHHLQSLLGVESSRDLANHAMLQALQQGQSWVGELVGHDRQGGELWEEVHLAPVKDEKGRITHYVVVMLNINQRKYYEQELRRARDAAVEANQAKSGFLAHMSHEIRTPMNGVLGMAQILAREGLTPDQHKMIDSILAAGRSLLGIINDILDLSKIEAGQLQLEPRPFDLNRTLAHVVSIGGVNARAKGIDLRLAVDPAIVGGWLGDALRLEQVLFNLAGNAIKFTEKGEVVIHVRPLELDAGHGRLRFEIEDSGIGMDAEAVARLFTPFSQADASITRRFGGTGLGLSISKRLVELMGGEIGVRSTPGVGSVFWFDWPASRVAAPEPEPKASGERGSKPPGWVDLKGLRVLVVDDSAINRSVAQRALKLAGVAVTLANDGEQALNRLREQPDGYDVVLMDIQMPVMDGLTAARAIRADPALASLPVLALSAGVLEEERESALAAGMNDFITKPLDLQQLNVLLARFMRHH